MPDLPDDDQPGASAGPIHPDDRLWRHPSELGLSGIGQPSAISSSPASTTTVTRRPQVAAVLLYSTAALLLMGGVWWASDQMNDRQPAESARLASLTSTSSAVATIAQIQGMSAGENVGGESARFGVTTKWSPSGIVVTWIGDDSPADNCGLRVGDIIVSVDGSTAATPEDLVQMVGQRRRGDTMSVRIRRGSMPMMFTISLDR